MFPWFLLRWLSNNTDGLLSNKFLFKTKFFVLTLISREWSVKKKKKNCHTGLPDTEACKKWKWWQLTGMKVWEVAEVWNPSVKIYSGPFPKDWGITGTAIILSLHTVFIWIQVFNGQRLTHYLYSVSYIRCIAIEARETFCNGCICT